MNKPEARKNIVTPLISIIAVLIGLALAIYLPNMLKTESTGTVFLQTDAGCSLNNGRCNSKLEDQQLALSIKSETIRSATPMLFEVSLENMQADQVMLDLKGKEMFMGLNQVMLSPVEGKPNLWHGEVTLAVCTTGEMTWISSVVVEKNGLKSQADFEFTAQ
ncbi:MAG: hypothetical protein JXR18_06455 [Neptuniibacter sp.]